MGLTPSQVEQYHEQGYLKLENVLDPETDLDPVIRAYEGVVDERARKLYAAGKISSLYEGEDFGHRLAKIAAEAPEAAQDLDIYKVRHPDMFAFLCNPKIHDLIESLVGPDILCHPCQHLRATAPTSLASITKVTPWHQDASVLWPEADDHLIVTTWIPLRDVAIDEGCLEVMPGSHKYGLVRALVTGGAHSVGDDKLPPGEPQPLPLKAGGMILFHNYTLHHARPNTSDKIRWSMDLRWHDAAKPTGRPYLPAFIVRSKTRPETEQHDYEQWKRRWEYAQSVVKGVPASRWAALDRGLIDPHADYLPQPDEELVRVS